MIIDGVGECLQWGELWLLVYANCGHEQYIPRNQWNYESAKIERDVRTYYADCQQCARDQRRASFRGNDSLNDR
jgi:hypothetical protein